MTDLTVSSTGGARLHVEIHGLADGPTVVLSHGWTCDTRFWYPVTRELADSHRVVLYDQRGHGRSTAVPGSCHPESLADDLCAVLDATLTPGQRAVVGGHSMGAMTIVAAAERPQLRERTVAALLCSTGFSRLTMESRVIPLPSGRSRGLAHRLLLGSALPMGPVTPLSQRILRYVTMGPGATAEQRARVARIVQSCSRKPRAEWGRALHRLELLERTRELRLPTRVVQGTADRLTPLVHAHRIVARLPDNRGLVELPGVGHMTPIEATGTVSDELRALVREHLTESERPDERVPTGLIGEQAGEPASERAGERADERMRTGDEDGARDGARKGTEE